MNVIRCDAVDSNNVALMLNLENFNCWLIFFVKLIEKICRNFCENFLWQHWLILYEQQK